MTRLIATWFYSGLIPIAPGTFGSLFALPFAYALHVMGYWPALLLAIPVVFVLGLWATTKETMDKSDHDPSEIVIDEVVGQWIALLPISYAASLHPFFPYPATALLTYSVLAFVFFRLFDITKPFPVSWADQKETPLGVMLDDVIAGIMAAIAVMIVAISLDALT